ncbi:MAG: MFS transporter, partial [Terriglobales bacterium]
YTMMFMGMAPFGSLFAGAAAEHLGAAFTVSVGAVACMGAAVLFFFHLPKIRVEGRQLIVAQEIAGGEPSVEMTARVVED